MEDNLIFEDNQIKKYENSKQYIEDTNRYHLTKELEDTKRKNAELTTIANAKMTKDLEREVKGQKTDEYNKKLYLNSAKQGFKSGIEWGLAGQAGKGRRAV